MQPHAFRTTGTQRPLIILKPTCCLQSSHVPRSLEASARFLWTPVSPGSPRAINLPPRWTQAPRPLNALRHASLEEPIDRRPGSHSTRRISPLVKAIKDYSYMDHAGAGGWTSFSAIETTSWRSWRHNLKKCSPFSRSWSPDFPKSPPTRAN